MAKRKRGSRGCLVAVVLTLAVLVGVPLAVLAYESRRTGKTWGQILFGADAPADPGSILPPRERIDFLEAVPIGDDPGPGEHPLLPHVLATDLDRDGLLDVVVCDTTRRRVSWIRQAPRGTFTERPLGDPIPSPSHAEAVDIDADGDLDLVVSDLGVIMPNNDRIGSLVILENTGGERFENRVVLEKVARVSDARAGDLDGDGDLDLAVAQFGYDDGETRWLENRGGLRFESHMLQYLPGPIHCPIADLDGDGDLDIVSLVSQEWAEIYACVNDGRGEFSPKLLYGSSNEDFGSSSLSVHDLDGDGDPDLLYTNGDAFDYIPPRPRPWHGIQWLENRGGLEFTFRRLGDFPGVTGAHPADVDGDGDLDVVAVSTFNLWTRPGAQSLIWLENDGDMRFARRDVTDTPSHLLTLAAGDWDGDGRTDFVSCGMHAFPPFDRIGRVTLFLNRWGER